MLDADEVADYEAWKFAKIEGRIDLSVQAYNLEREASALAWDEGWLAKEDGKKFTDNRFRKPGMLGHKPGAITTAITSTTSTEEEEETP